MFLLINENALLGRRCKRLDAAGEGHTYICTFKHFCLFNVYSIPVTCSSIYKGLSIHRGLGISYYQCRCVWGGMYDFVRRAVCMIQG